MALFQRFRKPREPEFQVYTGFISPLAEQLDAALTARDWRTLRDLLSTVDDPHERSFYLEQCAETTGLEEWVEQWVGAEPGSALATTVAGLRGIHWAWEARTGKAAKHVSAEQFRVFHHRLRRAEQILERAADLDKDDPEPWVGMVTIARGLQHDLPETWRRFGEVTARYRWHLSAHEHMLQQLCEKWGGSHELMHEFADRTVAEMPAGSQLGVLGAQAQFEHWMRLPSPEDEHYVESPGAIAALRAAAVRSIWHPDYRQRLGWPQVHNQFAMCFMHNQDWRSAAAQFDVIGPHATAWPWEYIDPRDPVRRFKDCRKLTYEAAAAAEAAERAQRGVS